MSSQSWSDAVGLALALIDERLDDHALISFNYAVEDRNFGLLYKAEIVKALETILADLLRYVAEDFGWDPEELASYILIEKFKRDLFDD